VFFAIFLFWFLIGDDCVVAAFFWAFPTCNVPIFFKVWFFAAIYWIFYAYKGAFGIPFIEV